MQEVGINSDTLPDMLRTEAWESMSSTRQEWLRATLQIRNESPVQFARAAGIDKTIVYRLLQHADQKPQAQTIQSLAAYVGMDPGIIAEMSPPVRIERVQPHGIALAIEAKRKRDGLSYREVAVALDMRPGDLCRLLERGGHARYSTLGRLVRWRELPPDQVLKLDGQWSRLSPVGQSIAPVLLDARLSKSEFAASVGTGNNVIWAAMTKGRPGNPTLQQRPDDPTLQRFADVLPVNLRQLRKAAKSMGSGPSTKLIKRLLRKGGREMLRSHAAQMNRARVRRTTPQQRQEKRRSNTLLDTRRRAHWATASDHDRLVFGAMHLDPRPPGRFGLCRVCGRLTFSPAWAVRTGSIAEIHHKCLAAWQRSSGWMPGRSSSGAIRKPPPLPTYRAGRRLKPAELGEYYETSVLYLRIKLGGHVRRTGVPTIRTVRDLALQLELAQTPDLAERRLRERVARLLDLLPDPETCNKDLAVKVRALGLLTGQYGGI